MRIGESYEGDRPVFSVEFFPPNTDEGAENLMRAAAELKQAVQPDFISVTYGAGGTTRDRTFEVVKRVQSELGIRAMAHQTCVAATRGDIATTVERLWNSGITNILALRGDPPVGQEWTKCQDGFSNAVDLVKFIRKEYGDEFGIGVAGYPVIWQPQIFPCCVALPPPFLSPAGLLIHHSSRLPACSSTIGIVRRATSRQRATKRICSTSRRRLTRGQISS